MSKKFPIYIQRDQKDCGSSCIIMLCTYYGLHYSADEVRDLCKISKSGVLLGEVSRILESFGFKTVGGFLNMDKLIHEAPLPMILHWEQDHFVILYKIKKKRQKIYFFSLLTLLWAISSIHRRNLNATGFRLLGTMNLKELCYW